MTTYGSFCDDILVTLGMSQDDGTWYRDNILQNALYCEHKLVTQSLQGDLGPASDGRGAQRQLSTVIVPVTYQAQPTDTQWAHLYFDLPSDVYDLPHDGGVNMVRYWQPSLPVSCPPSIARAVFTPTTLSSLNSMYGHRHMAPSESRPYYARARAGMSDRVYLFGVSPLITSVFVALFAAPRFLDVSFDDKMQANPQQLFTLKRMVLEMSVWPLQIPQSRLRNDGRDLEPGQVVNTRPIISVNDPAVLENPSQQ